MEWNTKQYSILPLIKIGTNKKLKNKQTINNKQIEIKLFNNMYSQCFTGYIKIKYDKRLSQIMS